MVDSDAGVDFYTSNAKYNDCKRQSESSEIPVYQKKSFGRTNGFDGHVIDVNSAHQVSALLKDIQMW